MYESQQWLPVASLFGLVGCPIPRDLKAEVTKNFPPHTTSSFYLPLLPGSPDTSFLRTESRHCHFHDPHLGKCPGIYIGIEL